ncbi:MAG: tetratricopeptide repeat protein, partial [Candidatus Electrothrix sp. EH2]|nr:tetratricopeptide repeat protein [Candidatus Electrothrix sp. EH2]
ERLEALLEEQPADREERTLLASLELSLERLPERCREWLPRLGVFQGGGLERFVQGVTEIEEADWQELRKHLLRSGLMREERVLESDEMIFLRFHPTLAPALCQKLDKDEQAELTERYKEFYQQIADAMREQDETNPYASRAIILYELPNLFRAVYVTLQAGGTEADVEFTDHVGYFLRIFGLQRDCQNLTEAATKTEGAMGSQAWFTARFNLGVQLWENGQSTAAKQVFQDILTKLDETPSYNRCLTLGMLADCNKVQGQPVKAEQLYQQELVELAQLKQCQGVRGQTGSVQIDLANVLRDQGKWHEAKVAYQAGLEIAEELGHKRNVAVSKGQLSTLARLQGDLAEAQEQCKEVIRLFQSLGEPTHEAIYTHQLGVIYQKKEHWESAEQAYRQAARLFEEQSLLAGNNRAAKSWGQLAQVCIATDRLTEAEQWFHKSLKAFQSGDDQLEVARTLYNLAILLVKNPARLDEARAYAEEGLAIDLTFNPAVVEIWNTYRLLVSDVGQQPVGVPYLHHTPQA